MNIVIRDSLSDPERDAVLAPLKAHNSKTGLSFENQNVAFVLQDDSGEILGGILGEYCWGWLYLRSLSVAESLQRQRLGTRLLDAAEQWVKDHGGRYVWLNTFSFQARPFYEKRGYKLFGELPDHPPGHRHYFLYKDLNG